MEREEGLNLKAMPKGVGSSLWRRRNEGGPGTMKSDAQKGDSEALSKEIQLYFLDYPH